MLGNSFFVPVKILFTFLLLIIAFTISAQHKNVENSNGYNIFYYPNGQISSEGPMVKNRPDGFWKSYYVDGIIKSEGKRINGFLDSVWVFYNKEGLIREKINYLNGKKNGYFYSFEFRKNNDNITYSFLKSEELYLNNKRNGISTFYYSNGVVKFLISYVNGSKSGVTKEFDKNGELITLTEFKDGRVIDRVTINRFQDSLKNGIWKEFYSNGKLRVEENYALGKLHGLYKEYSLTGELITTHRYANGILVDSIVDIVDEIDILEEFYNLLDSTGKPIIKNSGGYIDGIPVGVHRTYDSLGRVNSSRLFNKNGVLIGEGIVNIEGDKVGDWIFYYPNGVKRSEGKYIRNRREDLWVYYYDFGGIEQRGDFKKGRPHGKWVWYFDTGAIEREEYYKYGKEEGDFNEFDINGNIVVQGSYINGLKEYNWFYDFDFHTEKGKYENGERSGEWNYFYKNGNTYFIGGFTEGNENGKHLYYYRNGQLKEKRYYVFGRKNKNWEFYDYYGSLLKILTFENNILLKIDGISVQIEEN